MSTPTDVPSVHRSSSSVAEADGAAAGVEAGAEDVAEDPLGAALHLHALVADLEARVLAVPDRQARLDAGQRAGLEQPLELQRGAARAAPRQRHGQPLADAEQIHRADPSAVGEAIAVGEADDRQEHQLAAQPADRPRDRVRHAGMLTPPIADRTPGFSCTTRTRATSLVLVERAITLPDLDRLEPAAVLQAAGDRLDAVGGERLPDGDPGEVEHLLVGQERVAVDADLADDLPPGDRRV